MEEQQEQPQTTQQTQNTQQESKGFSIASMVLGIISVVLFCFAYISIPGSILAIIFGAVGMKKGGKGMAIAGIVLGIIAIVLYGLTVLGALSLFSAVKDLDVNSVTLY